MKNNTNRKKTELVSYSINLCLYTKILMMMSLVQLLQSINKSVLQSYSQDILLSLQNIGLSKSQFGFLINIPLTVQSVIHFVLCNQLKYYSYKSEMMSFLYTPYFSSIYKTSFKNFRIYQNIIKNPEKMYFRIIIPRY